MAKETTPPGKADESANSFSLRVKLIEESRKARGQTASGLLRILAEADEWLYIPPVLKGK